MYLTRDKPTFKFNSFADFVAHHRVRSPYIYRTNTTRYKNIERVELKYPCFYCYGIGRIVDPQEVSDVIEGHKLSRRIDCPKCEGTAESTEKAYIKVYGKIFDEYQKTLIEWSSLRNLWLNLDLTEDDWRAIGIFGQLGPKE